MRQAPRRSAAPIRTANGVFGYDDVFWGAPLRELVDGAHRALGSALGWRYFPLPPGAFGFDNMAVSLGMVARAALPLDEEAIAAAVHNGWCINYEYWRDRGPGAPYRAPPAPLGDARREACLVPYRFLSESERSKDLIIARFIIERVRAAGGERT